MKKIIFFIIFTIFILSFSSLAGEVKADSLSGYAWSENIGWISLNSLNCDIDGDGVMDRVNVPPGTGDAGAPADCPIDETLVPNYGVAVDLVTTGDFSGYAWSENIGWIRLDPPPDFGTGVYPNCPPATCPTSPNYSANLNLGTNEVSGWARACAGLDDDGDGVPNNCQGPSRTDGWDGWILLGPIVKGVPNDGVSLDTTPPDPDEFTGWAWGSDVVGWISFNCLNRGVCTVATGEGGPSDYNVFIIPPPNQAPLASNLSLSPLPAYCNILSGVGQVGFEWTYTDGDGDDQQAYRLQVATDAGYTNLVVDSTNSQTVSPGQTGTSAVQVVDNPTPDTSDLDIDYDVVPGTPTTYWWRVQVKDCTDPPGCTEGSWSVWAEGPSSFTTPAHAYPWPNFTCNTQDDCSTVLISAGETVTLADISTFYGGAVLLSRLWTLPPEATLESGTTADSPIDVTFSEGDNLPVTLQVTDSDGFSCSTTENLNVTSPLPEWKEIAPTGWLSFPKFVFPNLGANKLLANILNILRLI